MKRIVATSLALVFALSVAPLYAAKKTPKTPEHICKAEAKKEHVAKSKLEAFMKTCVEKHTNSTKH